MSDQERDLQRVYAWDRYKDAKIKRAAQKQRLSDYIDKFSAVAGSLRARIDDLTGDELATLPTPIEYKKAVGDYRGAVADLKSAETTARELGWSSEIDSRP